MSAAFGATNLSARPGRSGRILQTTERRPAGPGRCGCGRERPFRMSGAPDWVILGDSLGWSPDAARRRHPREAWRWRCCDRRGLRPSVRPLAGTGQTVWTAGGHGRCELVKGAMVWRPPLAAVDAAALVLVGRAVDGQVFQPESRGSRSRLVPGGTGECQSGRRRDPSGIARAAGRGPVAAGAEVRGGLRSTRQLPGLRRPVRVCRECGGRAGEGRRASFLAEAGRPVTGAGDVRAVALGYFAIVA